MTRIRIGVLALQGAFSKHIEMLEKLNIDACEIRKPEELADCDALIIPGGESTTIFTQMDFIHFSDPLREFASHKPIFGTCAGLILMSEKILTSSKIPFGFLNVTVERNAFGRQAESFRVPVDIQLENYKIKQFPALFIRAPRIRAYDSQVKILASYQNEPILVQQGHHLGSTFHPELTHDPAIHSYFLSLVEKIKKKK